MRKIFINSFCLLVLVFIFSISLFYTSADAAIDIMKQFENEAPKEFLSTSNHSISGGSDQNRIPNPIGGKTNSLQAFFLGIVSICIQLGTIVAVLAIMYGGFLYVTAQGDEEKLGKAYKTITWALVGTAILLGSRTIMVAVTDTVKQLGAGIN